MSAGFVPYGHPDFLAAFGAAWSSGHSTSLLPFFTPDAEYVETAYGTKYTGPANIAKFQKFMHAFTSETRIVFLNTVGSADGFAMEWVWSGVSTGPMAVGGKLYQPTGKPFKVAGVAVCRVAEDGRLTYHRDYYDVGTVLRQIGAVDEAAKL
jgi:limonene-1,2-epoxide hydrolase